MKKFVAFLLCTAIMSSLLIAFMGCNDSDAYQINTALLSDNGYIDYAKEVEVNVETYPTLSDQGLFIVSGYDEDNWAIEVDADDATNIKNHFDPTLPSIIIVHGVQLMTGRHRLAYYVAASQGDQFDLSCIFHSGENAQEQKWNTFYFHYEKFADAEGSGTTAGMNPTDTEKRIWMRGTDNAGIQFVQPDGTYSGQDALSHSLAEWFSAEYIRTMNCINAEFPEYAKSGNEIRTAAHSMGGALTVATVSLLNILSLEGQLSRDLLPDRMAMLDSYIGGGGKDTFKISWSDKKYINGSPRSNYFYSLENIVKQADIAVEFYYNQKGWVPFTGKLAASEAQQKKELIYFKEISELAPMILLYPAFSDVVQNPRPGGVGVNGHNAIYEWYFTSYKFGSINYYDKSDFVIDELDYDMGSLKLGAKPIGTVPTASTPTEQIRKMRGLSVEMKRVWMTNEYATVECDDDVFVTM